jgi:hypothetical protein
MRTERKASGTTWQSRAMRNSSPVNCGKINTILSRFALKGEIDLEQCEAQVGVVADNTDTSTHNSDNMD